MKYNAGFAIDIIDLSEEIKKTTPLTTDDYIQIEANVMKYLRKKFPFIRDEGHGSNGELIGTIMFDSNELLEEIKSVSGYEPLSTATGSYPEMLEVFAGVPDNIDAVVSLDYFNILEWNEEEDKYVEIQEEQDE